MVLSKKEGASLLFFEKGKWIEIPSKQQIAFTNVFRWTKDPKGEIHLEHLRFGMQKPFSLFTLTPVGKNHYRSLNPYECKEDIYVAHVLFDDHYVHLQWKISGPKKKENFTIAYF